MNNREKFYKTFGVEIDELNNTDPWWEKEYNPRWQKRCRDCVYLSDRKYRNKYLCNCPEKTFRTIEEFYRIKGTYACNHFKEKK